MPRRSHASSIALLVLGSLLGGAALPDASAGTPPAQLVAATYDPGRTDLGEDVDIDAEGNLFVTGIAERGGQQDIVTVKFSPRGVVLWFRIIDESKADRADAIVATGDGGAVVAGTINRVGGDDLFLRKYSSNGTTLWSRTYDKGTSETARGIARTPDGAFLVTGASVSVNGADAFVFKVDANGDEIWSKPINLFFVDEGFDVASTPEGGAVVAGRVTRDGSFDVIVRKFSPSGDELWTETIATALHEEARGVAVAADGSVFVAGTTTTAVGDRTHQDILLARFSPEGKLAWSKAFDFGGDDQGREVALDASGNLVVCGFGAVGNSKDALLVKVSPDGTERWRRTWGGNGTDGAGGVAVRGGRIAMAGATQDAGLDYDYFVVVYEETLPKVAFTSQPTSGPAPGLIQFRDGSLAGGAALVAWEWQFGDGTHSSAQNPEHQYAYGGEYDVNLTVHDDNGNIGRSQVKLAVDGPPPPAPVNGTTPTPAPSPTPAPIASPTPQEAVGEDKDTPFPVAGALFAALLVARLRARGRR